MNFNNHLDAFDWLYALYQQLAASGKKGAAEKLKWALGPNESGTQLESVMKQGGRIEEFARIHGSDLTPEQLATVKEARAAYARIGKSFSSDP